MSRTGPAGDYDYESGGAGYATIRRPDPRIAAQVWNALGSARTVVNVGAGAGSYEPHDRDVTAVEPSMSMRLQRPANLVAAIDAVAESLPFGDNSFDAAMATVTVHQWPSPEAGLREMRRVAVGPVVILTFDGDALDRLWLCAYFPEFETVERHRYPSIDRIAAALGGSVTVDPVPIPIDCIDGFTEAFYARPEAFLDPAVRAAQSAWAFVSEAALAAGLAQLAADLDSGEWDARYGQLRGQSEFVGALRLITAWP